MSRRILCENSSASISTLAIALLCCVSVVANSNVVQAEVRFDAVTVVDCHDVTDPHFAAVHPDERIIEAIFSVSAFSPRENYQDIDFVYQIISPNGNLRVIDYLPNTSVTSEYATNIAHERGTEKASTIGVNGSGTIAELVSLGGEASTATKKNSQVSYEKLPPTQVLSASGTIARGSGVFFKLKPSSQTTLEGSRDYVVTFRVPAEWRGDVMELHCRARRMKKGNLFAEDSIEPAGSESFLIAMYLDYDPQAKAVARDLAVAEQQLRRQGERYQRGLQKSASSFSFVSTSKSGVPTNWISQIVFDDQPRTVPRFVKTLPGSMRDSVVQFARAKLRLMQLAG